MSINRCRRQVRLLQSSHKIVPFGMRAGGQCTDQPHARTTKAAQGGYTHVADQRKSRPDIHQGNTVLVHIYQYFFGYGIVVRFCRQMPIKIGQESICYVKHSFDQLGGHHWCHQSFNQLEGHHWHLDWRPKSVDQLEGHHWHPKRLHSPC